MAKAGLPKQFARLGFKKGWAAFRKFKGSKGAFNTLKLKAKKKTGSGSRVVTVHKKGVPAMGKAVATSSKTAALKARLASALRRARGSVKVTDPMEAGIAILEGFGGGVATSFALGAIPTGSLPKPGLIKSGAQAIIGGVMAFQKNKHVRYIGYGTAVVGLISVARELFPIPTFAGEVDTAMFGEDFSGEEEFLGYDENGVAVYGDPLQGEGEYMGDPLMGDPLMGEAAQPSWNPFG